MSAARRGLCVWPEFTSEQSREEGAGKGPGCPPASAGDRCPASPGVPETRAPGLRGSAAGGRRGRPGTLGHPRSARLAESCRPGPGVVECPAEAASSSSAQQSGWAPRGCVPQAATLLGLCANYCSRGGGGAGGQPREGGAGASPCTLRPGSRAPGFPAFRLSPRVPPPPLPRSLTSAAGCPGLLALVGKVDCLGRLLLHLGWVSGPGGSRRVLNFSLTLTVE